MIIREATSLDTPKIVEVLKASLGDELPISQAIWEFKHLENPYGSSIVLLAEEDGTLIGVRAFMKWKWCWKTEEHIAYRAVDTATHPHHRGKGIFKKLTLAAVDIAKDRGHSFIFNTPNDQSRPGYLKMGWQSIGKVQVGLIPAINSFWKINNFKDNWYKIKYDATAEEIDLLCNEWNRNLSQKGLFTPKSYKYLKWRYDNNPLQQYSVYATSEFYISATVRRKRGLKELRLTECIFNGEEQILKQIKKIIKKWSSEYGIQVISFSPELLELRPFSIKGSFGPMLTVRNLNLSEIEESQFLDLQNWSFGLGDLELF